MTHGSHENDDGSVEGTNTPCEAFETPTEERMSFMTGQEHEEELNHIQTRSSAPKTLSLSQLTLGKRPPGMASVNF
jgi:hypothetical protein